jgi:meso-butanediol dehydrogenase / (S,S)-butanediol dehydrogenase / diacetyl reductase
MRNVRFDFTGQAALVTGGASGMGRAIATLFAEAGATVMIVDQNAALAAQTAAEIGATATVGPIATIGPIVAIGDVGDAAFCDAAVRDATTRFGRLDAVVNAAGVIARKTGLDTTDDEWARVMRVNSDGVYFMTRAAARHMRAHGGGAVVNFGSIWGELGGKGAHAYTASKGAVHQITRTFALELARDGVRVNCVCPGEVDTPMLRTAVDRC